MFSFFILLRIKLQYSSLYYFFIKFRKKYKELYVNSNTNLVLEGWPRSGNTFLVFCINTLNEKENKDIKIAHHIHVPLQVRQGIKLNLKTVVLIRNPKDSISSLIIKRNRVDNINSTYLDLLLTSYIEFYKQIINCSNDIIIFGFNDVIKNTSSVINSIQIFEPNISNIDFFGEYKKELSKRLKIDRTSTEIALPNKDKEMYKADIIKAIEDHKRFLRAMEIYKLVNEKSVKL